MDCSASKNRGEDLGGSLDWTPLSTLHSTRVEIQLVHCRSIISHNGTGRDGTGGFAVGGWLGPTLYWHCTAAAASKTSSFLGPVLVHF
ncbi:hypothetical protein ACLOJK_041561 [Asimina triloba]